MSEKITDQIEEQVEVDVGATLLTVNECLIAIHKRLEVLEKYVNELPTPDKTYYKPEGYEDYLNLPNNLKEIYRRIGAVENGMQN
jgi:maleate cis-trans isomerase